MVSSRLARLPKLRFGSVGVSRSDQKFKAVIFDCDGVLVDSTGA